MQKNCVKKIQNNILEIEKLMNVLKNKRPVFYSEADFQLELGRLIVEKYPNTKVRMEYCPKFDCSMHIDILVLFRNKWIPIELKYKTKHKDGEKIVVGDEEYQLKNHSAKPQNCYKFCHDLQRIEKVKENTKDQFLGGYAIFLTNDISYKEADGKGCSYEEFAINDGSIKKGEMNWSNCASEGTKKGCEKPIILKGEYPIKWREYSEEKNHRWKFIYTIAEIKR